eukprot:11627376-Karenia_brevis.AAC.1
MLDCTTPSPEVLDCSSSSVTARPPHQLDKRENQRMEQRGLSALLCGRVAPMQSAPGHKRLH